jgi:hypothetical protein
VGPSSYLYRETVGDRNDPEDFAVLTCLYYQNGQDPRVVDTEEAVRLMKQGVPLYENSNWANSLGTRVTEW